MCSLRITERDRRMSNPNPPAPVARAPRWLVWLGLLALAGYGVFIKQHFSIVASGSDASGYLNSARLLAAGRLQADLRVPAEFASVNADHFQPLGFIVVHGSHITPTYPTGLPLHLALAGKIFGWITGPRLVGLFAALGAVWLCYAVGRELGLDARLAAAGAVALGACPMFLFTSFQPMSDTLAATWCLAAVWAALRARRAASWAAACGAAFAIAVLVRPTNLVLLPALLVVLGWDWRRLVLATLGGLPGVAWLAFYNHVLYGGALHTGYGAWFSAFAWSWGPPTAWHFAKWLALLLPAPFLLLPFVAFARRESRTRGLFALAVWFAAITGFYTFYAVSHEVWWCLRFIVPAIPALILASLLGLEVLAQRCAVPQRDRFRSLAAQAIAVWAIGLAAFWIYRSAILEINNGEKTYAKACAAAREQFPPGTLVATVAFSGAFYYYTDFAILRWDGLEPAEFARLAALAQKAGRTVAAVEFKWEETRALHEHCPGNWRRVGQVGDAIFWRLGPTPPGAGPK